MIQKTDAERIAAAIHALRPDWPINSLMTLLAELRTWPLRDLATQLAWIATDQDHDGNHISQTPARIKETGPWSTIGITEANNQTAKDRAAQAAAERKASIRIRQDAAIACPLCDDNGRTQTGWLCRHDADTNTRAQQAQARASEARTQIRPMRKIGEIAERILQP